MRQDFENIQEGDLVKLFPSAFNNLHFKPVEAYFNAGYFYCKDTPAENGPDYYFGDVFLYTNGFEILERGQDGNAADC